MMSLLTEQSSIMTNLTCSSSKTQKIMKTTFSTNRLTTVRRVTKAS